MDELEQNHEKDFSPIVQDLLAAIRQIEQDGLFAQEASAIAEELYTSEMLSDEIRHWFSAESE